MCYSLCNILYNHVRSCDALLGVPLDEPIQCIVSDGKRIFTAAGHHVHVWKRGKKVCELTGIMYSLPYALIYT